MEPVPAMRQRAGQKKRRSRQSQLRRKMTGRARGGGDGRPVLPLQFASTAGVPAMPKRKSKNALADEKTSFTHFLVIGETTAEFGSLCLQRTRASRELSQDRKPSRLTQE
jgi:hypothetical protein